MRIGTMLIALVIGSAAGWAIYEFTHRTPATAWKVQFEAPTAADTSYALESDDGRRQAIAVQCVPFAPGQETCTAEVPAQFRGRTVHLVRLIGGDFNWRSPDALRVPLR